jgi:type IV secretion system protein VirB10
MSGTAPERGGSERDIAAALRLRPDPPRVVRLSRRVLIGLGVAVGLGIGAALIVALQGRSSGEGPRELYSTDRNPQADGLAGLLRDYAGIPQLGPPLPGDLGRPIVRAQERGQPVVPPAAPTTADPAEQRRLQEIEAVDRHGTRALTHSRCRSARCGRHVMRRVRHAATVTSRNVAGRAHGRRGLHRG